MDIVVERLLNSSEPSVVLRASTHLSEEPPGADEESELRQRVRDSERVRRLLCERDGEGRICRHPYSKWDGAHWILTALAELGYPPGDEELVPLREQVYAWLLAPAYLRSIRSVEGRVRRHASMEGNAILSMLRLGLADERTDKLAGGLVDTRWPDGGWNCDPQPEASTSSFEESLIPMRALGLHGRLTGNKESARASNEAAELFLSRRLYLRRSDGTVIKRSFALLHHPPYWHYDILVALEVMVEVGLINDERCRPALDLLESKRLPDGSFPAEERYWQLADGGRRGPKGRSLVDWGATGKRRSNEFVTVRALSVLRAAERG